MGDGSAVVHESMISAMTEIALTRVPDYEVETAVITSPRRPVKVE